MSLPPESVLTDIRQNLGLEADDASQDQEISRMSKAQQLNCVATWNGLIGFGPTIIHWVESIYGTPDKCKS